MPYTDQQITDYARQLEQKGASLDKIKSFVQTAKKEQILVAPVSNPSKSVQQKPQTFAEEQAAIQLPSEKIKQSVMGESPGFGRRFLGNLAYAASQPLDVPVRLWKSVSAAEEQARVGVKDIVQGLKQGDTIKTGSGFTNIVTSPFTAIMGIPGTQLIEEPLEPLMGAVDTAFRVSGKLSGQNPYSEEYQKGVIDPTMGALMTMLMAAGGSVKAPKSMPEFTTNIVKELLNKKELPKEAITIIQNQSIAPKALTPRSENAVNVILQSKFNPNELQLKSQGQLLFNIIGESKPTGKVPTFEWIKNLVQEKKAQNPVMVNSLIEPVKDLPSTAPIKPLVDTLDLITKQYPELAVIKKNGLSIDSPLVKKLRDMIEIQKEYYRNNRPTIGQDQIRKQGLYQQFRQIFEGKEVNLPQGAKLVIDRIAQGLKENVENGIKDPVLRQNLIDWNLRYGDLVELELLLKRQTQSAGKAIPEGILQQMPGVNAAAAILNRVLGSKGIPISLQGAQAAKMLQSSLPKLVRIIRDEYKTAKPSSSTLGKPGTAAGIGNVLDIVRKYPQPVNLRPQVPLLPARTGIPGVIPLGAPKRGLPKIR